MKNLKKDLAQWLVNENDDCGNDTFFSSEDRRNALTTEESFNKFMRDYTKKELIELIYNFSDEGQTFLETK